MKKATIAEKNNIYLEYTAMRANNKMLRARDAAQMLNISEGELVAAQVGFGATRLSDNIAEILGDLQPLGELMALTRNDNCVHERKGIYDNFEIHHHGKMTIGLFVNPDIDLRLFLNHWQYAFALNDGVAPKTRKSLQFFDKYGTALHKIYLTDNSDEVKFNDLVAKFTHENQDNWLEVIPKPAKAPMLDNDEIDWAGLRVAWKNLKDTHDFDPMLRKFKVSREQAFTHIGSDFAYLVDNYAAREVCNDIRNYQTEMMIFVGNHGVIQIYCGPVNNLLNYDNWYNIMDPNFNLHLREDKIANIWVVKKPTLDGIITSLEIFDKNGEIMAIFFGKRHQGNPEKPLWRDIIAKIMPAISANIIAD